MIHDRVARDWLPAVHSATFPINFVVLPLEFTEMAQLSYVHGASETPLIGETIGNYFDRAAEQYGARDALIVRHQNIRWSWRELKQRVDDFAAGLLALGLKRGERIGIWSPNNTEWVVTQFATAKGGADPRQH